MKRMIKKTGALLMALVVCMAFFAACAGGSSSTASTSPSGSAAVVSSTPAPAGERETLEFWHYYDERTAEVINRFAEEFNAMQDEVTVVATHMARAELLNQYTIGVVSGELPDIGMVDGPDMASFVALGVFEDITDELDAWGEVDQFYPGPMNSCKDADGRIYGLPGNTNCLALLCNMDMLNAANMELPTTWEEFEAVCAATTNAAEQVYGFAMSAVGTEEGTFQFIPWLYAAGGSVADLGSAESVRALDFLAGLVDKGYMSREVANWGQTDAFAAFAAGKAAMVESGTWQIANNIPEMIGDSFEYQYTLLPKDKTYASVIGGENFGVCAGTKNKQAAVDFLTYMCNAENIADRSEFGGTLPVRKDSAELRDIWTTDPHFKVFNEAMNYAVPRGPHPEWPTISKSIYTAEQSALLGEATAAAAMEKAAAEVAPLLEETPIAQ